MSEIRSKYTLDGTDDAGKALDYVVDRLKKLEEAEKKASTAAERLERALEGEADAARKARQESERSKAAVNGLGESADEANRKFGETAGVLGNVGSVIGQTNPRLSAAAGIFGAVGSAATAASGAMGPFGIAVAGVTTAIGLYNIAAEANEARLELQRQEVDRLKQSYDEIRSSISAAIDETVRMNQVLAGQGSNMENLASLTEAQNRLRLLQRAQAGDSEAIRTVRHEGVTGETRAGAGSAEGISGLAIRAGEAVGLLAPGSSGPQLSSGERSIVDRMIERQMGRVQELSQLTQEGAARTLEQAQNRDTMTDAGDLGGNRSSGAAARRAREAERQAEAARQARMAAKARENQATLAMQEEEHREWMQQWSDQMDAGELAHQARVEQQEEEHRLWMESWEAQLSAGEFAHEQRTREVEERRAQLRSMTTEATQHGIAIATVFTDAMKAAISGEMSFEEALMQGSKRILVMIGDQLVAKGIGAMLEGITMTVTNPPGAATKIGGGAAMLAFGVGLGAAGAAMPSPSSASAPAGPERPRQDQPSEREGGSITLVQNINSPIQTAQTNAALARQLRFQASADLMLGGRM